jgi:hypothetical protein
MNRFLLCAAFALVAGCQPNDPPETTGGGSSSASGSGSGSGSGGGGGGPGADGFFAVEVLVGDAFVGEIAPQRCRYAGDACAAMLECDTTPLPEGGFGDITLSDGTTTLTMKYADGSYSLLNGSFQPGATLTTSAAAGWQTTLTVPTMDTTITAPPKNTAHPVNDPLTVTWMKTGHSRLLLSLRPAGPAAPGPRCWVDASTGEFTLSPEVLKTVGPAPDLYLCVRPMEVGEVDQGGWHFETQVYNDGNCVTIDLQ